MTIAVIDNYDSFVYNLVHMLHELQAGEVVVFKNDKVDLDLLEAFDKILLSPGPGLPKDAGLMPEILKRFAGSKSILGICLGHQAIAECFGGSLFNMQAPLHGVATALKPTQDDYLWDGIAAGNKIGHYHSWLVSDHLPSELEVIAVDEAQQIMAIRHKVFDVRGLQFHPESVLTENGLQMMANWLKDI